MNRSIKKRALFLSLASIFICSVMLMGTTYAWFTDSVTSASNVITAGNLDVDVYYGDPADKESIQDVKELFDTVKLWEPGAVAYENITVANIGTLALKYNLTVGFTNENYIEVDGELFGLSDILKVGLVEGGLEDDLSREEALSKVTEWKPLEDLGLKDKELAANTTGDTLGVVIYWEPGNEDDNYNLNNKKTTSDGAENLHIDLGINLVATQLEAESDSFGTDYDKDATYPIVATGVIDANTTEHLELTAEDITVTVPKDAPAGNYKLTVTDFSVETDENDVSTLNTNITLEKDGAAVVPGAADYDVSIQLDPMLDINAVYHKNEEIADFNYDPFTGIVTFKTSSFSPFSIEYEAFGTEVVIEGNQIHGGFFEEVNPATLDASLLGNDSEYIAVDYVKDGIKYYAVSKRDTTVIVGKENYEFENKNIPETTIIEDNKLYSVISGLQNKDHSTVYILPGTYNEGTTINVYSNMDIIGLGDAKDIKIIKVKGSYSNRHLFNVNGAVTRDEHIQVTIRNLYLDASAKNLNSAGKFYFTDNAAVQSIRLSKVKCYDLIINKSSGYAFYVNGKYDARGAYMYVENCTMTTNSVVDTASTYRFYYDNLTYGKGEYTNNTSYIKPTTLEWNDWVWVKE